MNGVDIVVGGQYGDEGKGQICAWLTHRQQEQGPPYHFAVRVGGSNAEHRFATPDNKRYTARVLPVAAWLDPDVYVVLGPGHMLKLDSFFRELEELTALQGSQLGRIFIDPFVGVIDPEHTKDGEKTAWRGSTHQGTGQAVAHKVLRDGRFKTAKDYPELKQFIYEHGTWQLLQKWLENGHSGLLEGSQGALLSLNHGYYPFCTSKDVTPAALLAEAGIPTKYVRHTYAIYRTVPMRVPGNSGPTGAPELTWEELEKAARCVIPDHVRIQTDSNNIERVFLWSWEDFNKSIFICGPDRLVLTFADWWPSTLMGGVTIEDHILNMEAQSGQRVVMLRNGPAWDDYCLLK